MIPVYVVYFFLFQRFVQAKMYFDEVQLTKRSQKRTEEHEARVNKRLTCSTFKQVFCRCLCCNTILGLSYFLAYGIVGYLIKRATFQINWETKKHKEIAFEVIFLFLQLGGLSTSWMLEIIKFKPV